MSGEWESKSILIVMNSYLHVVAFRASVDVIGGEHSVASEKGFKGKRVKGRRLIRVEKEGVDKK